MATSTENISLANDTLARRRQQNSTIMMHRQAEVFALVPEIEEIGYEITSLGAKYTMATLAKNAERAAEIKQKMTALQDKQTNLLLHSGFAADYLEPVFTCSECRDKGFVNGKICTCLKQEIVKQRQNMLTALSPAPKTTFEDFHLDYYPDKADDNGINPRQQMANIFEYCKSFAENFSTDVKSIFMYGSSGLGKTHLSCAIADVCLKKGFVVMYASSQSLFEQIEQNKHNVHHMLNDIMNCDLFILDDLGTEYLTYYGQSILYNIINTRMINGTPCIYTSNLTSEKDLVKKYGEKITSRLMGNCDSLYFVGNDIRPKL
ncbi:MAG: hypothetical protein E7488_02835 [Ruminococcaceae bacterium]|nr:hypothetical protein [Oscillospiraceae bacterium]